MLLSEVSVVYTYDELDNVIEEHTRGRSRDGSVDDDGRLRTSNESFNEEWVRYEYRPTIAATGSNGSSSHGVPRSLSFIDRPIERRTITYFGG